MANKFIGETSGKYWKQKNDETYVNEDELVKITDLEEGETVDDDDLLIKGNPSTGTMLRIKVANFLDGIKEKLLGNTDISSVGDGTVTGAISENAEKISENYDELNSALADLRSSFSFRIETVGTYTFPANSYVTCEYSIDRNGYTPIAIVGAYSAATNAYISNFNSVTLSNGNVSGSVDIYSTSSSERTGRSIKICVLWMKNNA